MRQNLRQTDRSKGFSDLGPLLLLTIVGSAVGVCAVVVMTPTSEAPVALKDAQAIASTPPRVINKPHPQNVNQKKKDDATALPAASLETISPVVIPTEVPSSKAAQSTPMLNVTTDSTTVFHSNSAHSSPVLSLNKGDTVKSEGLQIIDSQGTWTLVRGKGRSSGFVSSEWLERSSPTDEGQK